MSDAYFDQGETLDVGQFKQVDDANDYIGHLRARVDRLQKRRGALAEALWEIVHADPVDLALDPAWAQRIARAAVSPASDEERQP